MIDADTYQKEVERERAERLGFFVEDCMTLFLIMGGLVLVLCSPCFSSGFVRHLSFGFGILIVAVTLAAFDYRRKP